MMGKNFRGIQTCE